MNDEERRPQTFSIARRFGATLNLVVTLAAVLTIVGAVNYVGMRRFASFKWTRDIDAELSRRTLHVLASLTNDVRIVTYYDSHDSLFPRVRALLKEYEDAGRGKIHVEHVDYLLEPTRAARTKLEFKLGDGSNRDLILFESNGRQSILNASTLSDYDMSKLVPGKTNEIPRTHFKGEMLVTSKIYGLAMQRSPKAYFLIGHGEHSPRDESSDDGYSKFGMVLENENNFELAPLDLTGTNEVPADCNLLVIAGPKTTIDDREAERIQRYLDQGGRLLAMFAFQQAMSGKATGLERVLASWGIEVGQDMVIDLENSGTSEGVDPKPITTGKHPIVNSLGSSRVHFLLPRSLRVARTNRRSDEFKVDPLLFTGPRTEIAGDFEQRRPRSRVAAPPQSLCIAVEKSIPGLERGATRIVVVGDSYFWSNKWLAVDANAQFAASTVNWLVQQNLLLSEIPRQAIRTFHLSMTNSQMSMARWLLLTGLPGAVMLVGFMVWTRRRK